jgi:hypothetical protein
MGNLRVFFAAIHIFAVFYCRKVTLLCKGFLVKHRKIDGILSQRRKCKSDFGSLRKYSFHSAYVRLTTTAVA